MNKKNKKIWQVGSDLHPLVEKFTVGEDYILDQKLIPYDLKASFAHAKMLKEMKVITSSELKELKKGIKEIEDKWKKGEFVIKQEQEDGHTAIEQYLTENFGEIGKKIHTGRSRNDQVLVMVRLYMKDKIDEIYNNTEKLQKIFSEISKKYKKIPMPGYTHMQKAMETTVGMWLDSYNSAIKDFLLSLKNTKKIIDQNPLGSASGFGISNFLMKREITTKELGFSEVQKNPIYCGFSRGYFENIVLQNFSQIMIIFSRFASDMMIFTTQEFNYFKLPNNFTTGSSIMPQKRNYDLFEIMRGNVRVFSSYQMQIQNIISGLGTGYHRDLQLTKKPFMNGVELVDESIILMQEIIKNLEVNNKKLENSMTDDLFLTNKIYDLVNKGVPFRDAYQEVKKNWFK